MNDKPTRRKTMKIEINQILKIKDTRKYKMGKDENGCECYQPIPNSGVKSKCKRCGQSSKVQMVKLLGRKKIIEGCKTCVEDWLSKNAVEHVKIVIELSQKLLCLEEEKKYLAEKFEKHLKAQRAVHKRTPMISEISKEEWREQEMKRLGFESYSFVKEDVQRWKEIDKVLKEYLI